MPTYISILRYNPDKIILIHSQQSLDSAKAIAGRYPGKSSLKALDPVDVNLIYDGVRKILEELAGKEVIVNVSSGTKPWSIVFAELAKDLENVSIVYVDQNNRITDFKTKEVAAFDEHLSVRRLIAYNGNEPSSLVSLAEIPKSDIDIMEDVMGLMSSEFASEYKLLAGPRKNYMVSTGNGVTKRFKGNSFIKHNDAKTVIEICLESPHSPKVYRRKWQSSHAFDLVLGSRYFELFTAKLISEWEHTRGEDVVMDVKFPIKGLPELSRNEIDVMAGTGSRLLLVECKTKLSDATDIDKFMNSARSYGGLGALKLFMTESSLGDGSRLKCDINRLKYLSVEDYQYDRERVRKELFRILDQQYDSINAL